MVLRSSSGSASDATVCDSVDSLTQNLIQEQNVIRDNTCSQMVFEGVATIDNAIDLVVFVLDNDLEGAE